MPLPERYARASRGVAALALLWSAGAVAACATPSGDVAHIPPQQAPAQVPGAPAAAQSAAPAPAGRSAGSARAPAGQSAGSARAHRHPPHHSFLADKIALQKQLLATLDDCPGARCPDAKLAAPATHACAQHCVTHWATCMGPCTVAQRFCEQHCTARKRECEDACGSGTPPLR